MFITRLIPLTHLTASPITGLNGKMTESVRYLKVTGQALLLALAGIA